MSYRIVLDSRVKRSYESFPDELVKRIDSKLSELSENPRPRGALKLKDRKGDGYRVRVGNVRILYTIDDTARTIVVYSVAYRKDAYRKR